jgi:hypothetical protein
MLAGVLAALISGIWMSAGPVSRADAATGTYCWAYNAGPWNICAASYGRPLVAVFGKGGQHAACTNAYELLILVSSWVCAGPNEWAQINFNGTRNLAGAVKNNTGSWNVLYGEMWW